jgi:hypothetical protein
LYRVDFWLIEIKNGSCYSYSSYMHHWRKDYFETLQEVATDASQSPEWVDYATFCRLYESGLRKQAFNTLDHFISATKQAPFSDRRRFVSWIMSKAEGRKGSHMLLPHPLFIRLIEPTLLEWTIVEPNCSEPHRWLGGYEHLKLAIELDPSDELARKKLIVCIMSGIDYAAHELPSGYLGNAREDLVALSEADDLVAIVQDDQFRAFWLSEIGSERKRIQDYLNRSQG